MSKGFWAGEAIATGLELAAAENGRVVTLEALRQLRGKFDALSKEYDELAYSNAANLAEKGALRKALARYDPKHPLLTNAHLKERIHAAGERVFSISNKWDDAFYAGRDFSY